MNLTLVLLTALLLPKQAPADPQEAKARNLFQQMQAKYTAAKTLTAVTTTKTYREKDGKKRLTVSVREQFDARRPSYFREEQLSQKSGQAVHRAETVSDGKTIWTYEEKDKRYIKTPVGSLLGNFVSSVGAPGDFFLFPEHSDGFTKPNPGITLRYLGKEKIAGADCDKIEVQIASPMKEIPASVQTYYLDAKHLVRRLVSLMKFKDETYTTEIDIQSTALDKNLPDALFTFNPPPGAVEKELPKFAPKTP